MSGKGLVIPAVQKRDVEQGVAMNELRVSNSLYALNIKASTQKQFASFVRLPRGVGAV